MLRAGREEWRRRCAGWLLLLACEPVSARAPAGTRPAAAATVAVAPVARAAVAASSVAAATVAVAPVARAAVAASSGPPAMSGVDRRADCLARNAGAPARYRGLVAALCAEHHNLGGVGVSLAVGERGALRFTATAGQRCVGGAPVDASTGFRVGSLTKLMTAALVLTLVDAGELDLDAPLVDRLPELGAGPDPRLATITLRQLLSHTAGLADPPARALAADADGWLQALVGRPLHSEPGALWSYSSAGYALVGAALERGTGEPFARSLQARLLAPMGLSRADLGLALGRGAACGHLGRGERALALDLRRDLELGAAGAGWTAPAGGVIAPAADLVELALGLADPLRSPISAAARAEQGRAEIPTDERPGEFYGLGVRVQALVGGGALWLHSGDTGDFAADLYFAPDRGIALAIVGNTGDHLQATAAAGLRDLLGVSPRRPGPAGAASRYVGRYALADGGELVVVARSDGLAIARAMLELADATLELEDVALEPLGDHRFRVAGRPGLGALTFVFRGDAAAASDLRGRDFVARRREAVARPAPR